MPWMESVIAPRILDLIWASVSVRRMREARSGDDFDIFVPGLLRDAIRRVGAGKRTHEFNIFDNNNKNVAGEGEKRTCGYVLATYLGRGKRGLNVLLKIPAISRASSRCCFWSSPTGTCVALWEKSERDRVRRIWPHL